MSQPTHYPPINRRMLCRAIGLTEPTFAGWKRQSTLAVPGIDIRPGQRGTEEFYDFDQAAAVRLMWNPLITVLKMSASEAARVAGEAIIGLRAAEDEPFVAGFEPDGTIIIQEGDYQRNPGQAYYVFGSRSQAGYARYEFGPPILSGEPDIWHTWIGWDWQHIFETLEAELLRHAAEEVKIRSEILTDRRARAVTALRKRRIERTKAVD